MDGHYVPHAASVVSPNPRRFDHSPLVSRFFGRSWSRRWSKFRLERKNGVERSLPETPETPPQLVRPLKFSLSICLPLSVCLLPASGPWLSSPGLRRRVSSCPHCPPLERQAVSSGLSFLALSIQHGGSPPCLARQIRGRNKWRKRALRASSSVWHVLSSSLETQSSCQSSVPVPSPAMLFAVLDSQGF